ncbi:MULTISPECIES: N-formylglutamate amidohydrolase [unclassified Marinovum]
MTQSIIDSSFGSVVQVADAPPGADVIVVCEHAANAIPASLSGLGISRETGESHVAWDPGALGVAKGLAQHLSAPLVYGCVSRLVYDCNRPPEAADAIPERSEVHEIPGNSGLSPDARTARITEVYAPFRDVLAHEIASRTGALALMVTVHSFTPVYRGVSREVEIGLLHGRDAAIAKTMLAATPPDMPFRVRLNEPYSAADGVAHTLDVHGAANNLPSVMLEIRSDLISTAADQNAMAARLAPWLRQTLVAYKNGEAA